MRSGCENGGRIGFIANQFGNGKQFDGIDCGEVDDIAPPTIERFDLPVHIALTVLILGNLTFVELGIAFLQS